MVRDWLRRWLKREHGQAIIETAFILPIILVIILTLVDFSRGIDQRDVLQHAVREGGRLAAVQPTPTVVQGETANQSQGLLTAANVTMCYPNGTANVGDPVRVKATYNFSLTAGSSELLHFFGISSSAFSFTMTPSFDFALEQAATGASSYPC